MDFLAKQARSWFAKFVLDMDVFVAVGIRYRKVVEMYIANSFLLDTKFEAGLGYFFVNRKVSNCSAL